jgi:hypothetical protein
MNSKTRIKMLKSSIYGLFEAAHLSNSEVPFSLHSFEGLTWQNLETKQELNQAISSMKYGSRKDAVQPLYSRVLHPLFQNASRRELSPTVVVVITSGDVSEIIHLPCLQLI